MHILISTLSALRGVSKIALWASVLYKTSVFKYVKECFMGYPNTEKWKDEAEGRDF